MGAVAAIDEMGVAIDEAGRDQTAVAIVGVPGGRRLGSGADPGDLAVGDQDGGILDEAVAVLHGGSLQIGQEHMPNSTCIRLYIQYALGHGKQEISLRLGTDSVVVGKLM